MPLPQNPNPISPAEKELLNAIKAQGEHLRSQTDVLKKLASSIMDNSKEFRSLRKDMEKDRADIKKEMMSGLKGNLSEIKKYFEKTNQRDNNRIQNKSTNKDDSEGGFFKSALGKLFGPSKYQQQMMFLAEMQGEDISFIKQNFEEATKNKDRELLAQAIAAKLNAANEGGGGSLGLMALGASLLAGLGTVLSNLGTMLLEGIKSIFTAALAGVIAGLGKLWDMVKNLYDWFKGGGSSTTPGQKPASVPGPYTELPDASRRSPVPTGPSQPELPNGQRQLPGPATNEPPRLPNGNVTDAEIKREGPRGTDSGKNTGKGLGIGKMGKAIGILGAIGAVFGGLYGTSDEEIAILKQAEEAKKLQAEKEKALQQDIASMMNIGDPTAEATFRQQQWDNDMKVLKENITSGITKGFEETYKSYVEPIIDFGIEKLDKLGEITMANGETINLLPSLGTSLAESVKELTEDVKDAAKAGAEKIGLINNSVTTNNVGSTSSPMPLVTPPTSNQNPIIRDYSYSRGLR